MSGVPLSELVQRAVNALARVDEHELDDEAGRIAYAQAVGSLATAMQLGSVNKRLGELTASVDVLRRHVEGLAGNVHSLTGAISDRGRR